MAFTRSMWNRALVTSQCHACRLITSQARLLTTAHHPCRAAAQSSRTARAGGAQHLVSAANGSTGPVTASTSYVVTGEIGMQQLAAALVQELHAGDAYLLYGAVGAGKSAFRWAPVHAVFCGAGAGV